MTEKISFSTGRRHLTSFCHTTQDNTQAQIALQISMYLLMSLVLLILNIQFVFAVLAKLEYARNKTR